MSSCIVRYIVLASVMCSEVGGKREVSRISLHSIRQIQNVTERQKLQQAEAAFWDIVSPIQSFGKDIIIERPMEEQMIQSKLRMLHLFETALAMAIKKKAERALRAEQIRKDFCFLLNFEYFFLTSKTKQV